MGDIEADIRAMNARRAEDEGGKLSWPSKMDCASWGISATRCHVGSRMREVVGSTCEGCYAMKGSFTFPGVKKVLEDNYRKLANPLWTPAMAAQIRWLAEERFRWFMAGDVQGINHLRNIIQVCLATPQVYHWLPTRELDTVRKVMKTGTLPANLVLRASGAMVDGPPPKGFDFTSTVVTDPEEATCPSSLDGGNCGEHNCTACWTEETVKYLKH
jgi:hypothetical protein